MHQIRTEIRENKTGTKIIFILVCVGYRSCPLHYCETRNIEELHNLSTVIVITRKGFSDKTFFFGNQPLLCDHH